MKIHLKFSGKEMIFVREIKGALVIIFFRDSLEKVCTFFFFIFLRLLER